MLSSLGGWLRSRGTGTSSARRSRSRLPGLRVRDMLGGIGDGGRAARSRARRAGGAIASPFTPLAPIAVGLAAAAGRRGQLDLSEWVHIATQGRDHYVEIVYEGELLPFRNRAALVKVTERKFKETWRPHRRHLFQRIFIVVREPEKVFDVNDRGMPFKRVRLTTLVTPDIAEPTLRRRTDRARSGSR